MTVIEVRELEIDPVACCDEARIVEPRELRL
jgi:hypothetical protein